MFTHAVHPPVRPWSPRSQGFPSEADAARTEAPRRRPEKTPLHKIGSENLESWLEWREAAERAGAGIRRGHRPPRILSIA